MNGTTSGSDSLTVNTGTHATTFSGTVGATTPLNNLNITADSLTFGGKVYGAGALTIQPYTASTNLHINDGNSSGLYLTGTEQGYLQNDWTSVVIGATGDTGSMTVGPTTWVNPLSLVSGSGVITIAGAQALGANNFTLETNATPVLSSTVTTTGNITVGTSGNTTLGVGTNATGTVNLSASPSLTTALNGGNYTFGSLSTGDVDINTGSSLANSNLTVISGGTIYLDKAGDTSPQTLTKNGGGTTTLTLQAGTDIVTAGAITASGVGNKLNVLFDSDYAGGGGAISGTGNITSNGGNITLGGQGSPAALAAVGDATYNQGIFLNNTLSAGGGNILITGTGYSGGGNGVYMRNMNTTGSGTITLIGTAGAGTATTQSTVGVQVANDLISAVNGNITLTGVGGNGNFQAAILRS